MQGKGLRSRCWGAGRLHEEMNDETQGTASDKALTCPSPSPGCWRYPALSPSLMSHSGAVSPGSLVGEQFCPSVACSKSATSVGTKLI